VNQFDGSGIGTLQIALEKAITAEMIVLVSDMSRTIMIGANDFGITFHRAEFEIHHRGHREKRQVHQQIEQQFQTALVTIAAT